MNRLRSPGRRLIRLVLSWLPRPLRYALYRQLVRCDVAPDPRLVLKLAETKEELEACFRLLHDAYVDAGFMKPDPSGMRVTIYHALPTTTTLLARFDGRVVGTVSLIRESAMGFPMQKIFRIDEIRRAGGNIAEVSALAIAREFQSAGGIILFPLMKFMYEYSTRLFDTRHLVIAVNPNRIALYESILFFRRLEQNAVDHYDFVNGAPAVGAHLDLGRVSEIFRRHYGGKAQTKNLFEYFLELRLPNIVFPDKRFYTTNDPVMTPELIEHFFNRCTRVFASMAPREMLRMHSIYDLPEYRKCLPPIPQEIKNRLRQRRHPRFSVICPARFVLDAGTPPQTFPIKVVECSLSGFRARSEKSLPLNSIGTVSIDLGQSERSRMRTHVLRKARSERNTFVFDVAAPDPAWQKFVNALSKASTHGDLEQATRFM